MLGGNIIKVILNCEIDYNYDVKWLQGQTSILFLFLCQSLVMTSEEEMRVVADTPLRMKEGF